MARKRKAADPMNKVDALIKKLEPQSVKMLQEFVRVDTTNPPGRNYKKMADMLARRLRALGFGTRVVRVPDREALRVAPYMKDHPRYNVLGMWRAVAGKAKTVHFNAHFANGESAPQRFSNFTRGALATRSLGHGSSDPNSGSHPRFIDWWCRSPAPVRGMKFARLFAMRGCANRSITCARPELFLRPKSSRQRTKD